MWWAEHNPNVNLLYPHVFALKVIQHTLVDSLCSKINLSLKLTIQWNGLSRQTRVKMRSSVLICSSTTVNLLERAFLSFHRRDVDADQLWPVLRVRMYRKKCPERRLLPHLDQSGMKKRSPYQKSITPCPPPSGTKADKRKSANADTNLSDQMKKLNPAQLRAFREVFENFDLEKSGTLTANELHQCINQLAGYQALSFDDVLAILVQLDVKVSYQ